MVNILEKNKFEPIDISLENKNRFKYQIIYT